jgi:hypothetical protein
MGSTTLATDRNFVAGWLVKIAIISAIRSKRQGKLLCFEVRDFRTGDWATASASVFFLTGVLRDGTIMMGHGRWKGKGKGGD